MPGKSSKPSSDNTPSVLTGNFVFANGDKYEGEYIRISGSQIERQGQGTQELASGITYTGVWVSDKMNGKGIMKHPNGSSYEGEFLNNEYHGVGMYTWPNGSIYRGPFEHNRVIGQGEYTDANGRIWTGAFSGKKADNLCFKLS